MGTMRGIKFRCWDKRGGQKMEHWDLENRNYYAVADSKEYYEIMQFTGLADKNGKDIYEGDIVNSKYYGVGEVWFGTGLQGEPADGTYPYEGWCFGHSEVTAFRGEDVEVIGNIFENADLLKK